MNDSCRILELMPVALANVIAPAAVSFSSSPGSAGRRRSAWPRRTTENRGRSGPY
jgi:hypothetical protein